MPPTPSTTTATTATPVPPSPSGPALAWVSSDLNVTVRGRILSQQEPGTIEGVVLQLEEQGGVEIKHPSLVSILTKPESQTLFNINTGERLFALSTPLIPDEAEESPSGDSAAVADDDDDEDPDGDVPSLSALDSAPSSASPSPSRSRSRTRPTTTTTPPKLKKPTLITLHSALLPFSSTSELESSPLYSRTFHIIIDGPSFPAPHFDPSSIVPPTPLVRPHGAAGGPGGEGLAGPAGVLNSPTLQRALLSPLLSPQRRASSQASDASVPPLNLGLSRTSRPSFTGGERPSGLRAQHGASPAAAAQAKGLAAFVPPVLPPGSSQQSSAGPSPSSLSPPPVPDLPSTLHTSLSTAAKKTAEEILSLRREHDLFVRRAKAELEVLEGRIEEFRANGIGGLGGGGEEGVVRGFRTKEDREREKVEKAEKSRSTSQSRDRSRSVAAAEQDRSVSRPRGSRDRERGRPGWGGAGAGEGSQQTLKATDMDESLSLRMRAEDEREEEERGRSRSRMRRGGADTAAEERRSRSRTKAVAEATRRAVEGAREKSASRDRGGGNGGGGGEEGVVGGRGTPRKGESIPATLEEEDEEEDGETQVGEKKKGDEGKKELAPTSATGGASSSSTTTSTTGPNGLLSPPPPSTTSTSATTAPSLSSSSSSSAPLAPAHPAPATPTFIPSSSKALLSVPEEEEEGEGEGEGGGGDGFSDLPVPPSGEESREGSRERGRVGRGREGREGRRREETGVSEVTVVGEDDLDEDQPFEMDEDVDADASSSRLAAPSPARSTDRRQSPATLEVERPDSNPPTASASQQQPISGSFKPGSFQRASALSASYAQLLTTHNTQLSRTPSPNPPPAGQSPLSALGSPATASRAADGLPPFSPPDAKSPVTTSAREDAHNALAASILERSVGAGVESVLRGNVRDQVRAGPDPRDVRRGEQKIRDVLAMDVPSHRPRAGAGAGRRASTGGAGGGTYTPDADVPTSDEDGEEDDDAEEGKDRVDDLNASLSSLRSPPSSTTRSSSHQPQFQVGSLPIALGRPSTVNAALSSWRPDPERLWVQEREKHRAGGGGGAAASGGRPEGPFSLRTGSGGSGRAPASPSSGLGTGGPPTPAGWTGATQAQQTRTQPVDIGSPTAAPPGAGTTTTGARSINIGGMQRANAGGGLSSSLAQSLRAAPASFSARAEAEQRFSLAQKDRLPPELEDPAAAGGAVGEGEDEDDEEEEDEEGFVPPHVVAERRERRDERYLSRSVSRR